MSWFNVSKKRRGGYYPHQKDQHRFLGRTKGLLLAAIFLMAQIASPAYLIFRTSSVMADTAATIPFSDSFGAANSNTVTGWDEVDTALITGTAVAPDTTQDGTDTNKYAKLGNSGGAIRRTIDATGYVGLQLKYYYRNDSDAESNDQASVQYCLGPTCSSGYVDLTTHNLDPSNNGSDSWSSQQTINLPGTLANTSFRIRFINSANNSSEDFRVDQVEITGLNSPTWPTNWTTPNACVADPSNDENPNEIDLIGSAGTPAVGFYTDSNYQYFRERVNGDPGGAGGSFHQYAWVTMLQSTLPEYQYLASMNGKDDKVQLWQNTAVAGPVDFSPILNDPAESAVWEGSANEFARSINIGDGTYYVDWAIPKTVLETYGITPTTTKFFATSADGNNFNKDHLNCYEALTDVQITKDASIDPIISGQSETYTLSVKNNGPDTATGVVVTDTLPAGFTPTLITPSQGNCSDITAPDISCELGTMVLNATATITVTGTLVGDGTVTNTTSVTSTTFDTNISNNTDSVDVTINPAVGSVLVNKKVDTDGNGTYEGGNAEANTLSFDWAIDAETVDNDMGSTQSSVSASAHTVTESTVSGYHFVGWYPTSSTQYNCANPEGTTLPVSITVTNNQTTDITLCNARDTGTLRLIKSVTNNSGGLAVAGNFTLNVKQNDLDVSGSPAAGSATGTVYTLPTGSYTVSESVLAAGYEQTGIVCGGQTTDTATVTTNTEVVCTITNDDVQPKLTVIKQLGNQYGDDAQVSDFPLFVDSTGVISGATNSFDAGTYAVSETNQTGYQDPEFSGDCDSSGEVTLNVGDEDKTCYITNNAQQPKLIVIKHVINDNQGPNDANDFTMTVNGTNVSDDSFPGNEQGTEVTLDEGNYTVDEIEVAGYTKSLSEDCTGTIAVGETKTCTITNDDQTGQVKVTKFYDSNENGVMDGNEASLEGWEIVLGDTTQMTGQDGTTTFENVNAGSHQLSENLQEDWKQSGLYCDYGEAAQVDDNLVYVKNGETLNCFIGNYRDPVLAINKTNSSPNAAVGNTITYTVVITVPEESGRVYGQPGEVYVPATLTDLPPDNFTYVLGSWTANSNIRGDLKAAGVTTEPTYASPGVWNLTSNGSNFLTPGEVITLTYQAVIGDAVTPGTYPDIAYVRGFDNSGGEVLGVAGVAGGVAASQCDDADAFASSCVAIAPPSQVLGASFTAGQVLGLANTGGAISKLQIIVPTLLISLTIIMVFATRRDVAKRGGAK